MACGMFMYRMNVVFVILRRTHAAAESGFGGHFFLRDRARRRGVAVFLVAPAAAVPAVTADAVLTTDAGVAILSAAAAEAAATVVNAPVSMGQAQ